MVSLVFDSAFSAQTILLPVRSLSIFGRLFCFLIYPKSCHWSCYLGFPGVLGFRQHVCFFSWCRFMGVPLSYFCDHIPLGMPAFTRSSIPGFEVFIPVASSVIHFAVWGVSLVGPCCSQLDSHCFGVTLHLFGAISIIMWVSSVTVLLSTPSACFGGSLVCLWLLQTCTWVTSNEDPHALYFTSFHGLLRTRFIMFMPSSRCILHPEFWNVLEML